MNNMNNIYEFTKDFNGKPYTIKVQAPNKDMAHKAANKICAENSTKENFVEITTFVEIR